MRLAGKDIVLLEEQGLMAATPSFILNGIFP